MARSFYFFEAEEVVVSYSGLQIRRCGFRATNAHCLTSTASQGLTLRSGTVVDCGRQKEKDDDEWWLHLYVMLSRVTSLSDLLLVRPPPRELGKGAAGRRSQELRKVSAACDGVSRGHYCETWTSWRWQVEVSD